MATGKITTVSVVKISPDSNVLLARWVWNKYTTKTKNYTVRWWYVTPQSVHVLGEERTVSFNPRANDGSYNCQYTIPDNAVSVYFRVIPHPTKSKYFKGAWSNSVYYNDADLPEKPSAPTTSLAYRNADKAYELSCELNNIETGATWFEGTAITGTSTSPKVFKSSGLTAVKVNVMYRNTSTNNVYKCTKAGAPSVAQWVYVGNTKGGSKETFEYSLVQWQFYRDDVFWASSQDYIIAGRCASNKWVEAGHQYKVRCRVCRPHGGGWKNSDWSNYSNAVTTVPIQTTLNECYAKTSSSIYLSWDSVKLATSYEIEYATDVENFDNTNLTSTIGSITTSSYVYSGIESGSKYFFRVRAVNSTGGSEWSNIKSIDVGLKPSPPTTWSSTTTAISGELMNLYWVHNSADGSKQSKAVLELDINGAKTSQTIIPESNNLGGYMGGSEVVYNNDYSVTGDKGYVSLGFNLSQSLTVGKNLIVYMVDTKAKIKSLDSLEFTLLYGASDQPDGLKLTNKQDFTVQIVEQSKMTITIPITSSIIQAINSGLTDLDMCYTVLNSNDGVTDSSGFSNVWNVKWSSLASDEDELETTSKYLLDTSTYPEGAKILWRVKTAGVDENKYSDWSTQRTINVYAKPTLALGIFDADETAIETLTAFPFYLSGTTSPSTQKPIGYYISITANNDHETTDYLGNTKYIKKGEEIYSQNIDTNDQLNVLFSAYNINLENNETYTITASASMDSGLTTEDVSIEFTVAWTEVEFDVDANVEIDDELLLARIRPFCPYVEEVTNDNVTETDEESEELVVDEEASANALFSVYRREFDGTFTELSSNQSSSHVVIDYHPALDYARYRVVGKSLSTGSLTYYDLPLYPVQEKSAVLQWDESKREFSVDDEPLITKEETWSGSMLKLPYNLDVSDSFKPDVVLVKYVGRENPVSYYGTQLGSTSTWNVAIEHDDDETLYQLRRLARWMGDVYVREPSGSGYWANVGVSFSQKHCDLTIPVTLSITRVEGGA